MPQALNDLFQDLLEKKSIFVNKEVLRASYIPEALPHRKEQINDLASILVTVLRGETPSNIFIYGKTGTGKTATVKYVGKALKETGEKKHNPCTIIYLNCEIIDTHYRVLYNLTRHFKKDIPPTGWHTDQVYSQFLNALREHHGIVVIILDEVDKLVKKGDSVLYSLTRINGELDRSKVSLIGISNDLKFTEYLDPRVKSSLGQEELIFPPYDANQLKDILTQRANLSFASDTIEPAVISLCAAFAAQEHGDARRALDLLRVSGELAERVGADRVTEEMVLDAHEKIEVDRVIEVLKSLPAQSKLLLYSILHLESTERSKQFTTGQVFSVYKRFCHRLDLTPLTKRRITDLISELDMLGIVNAVVVSYGRFGRTKEISLSIPIQGVEALLLTDTRLSPLGDIKTQSVVQSRLGWKKEA